VPDRASPISTWPFSSSLEELRWLAANAAAASATPARMIAAPAVALARFDRGAMEASYHANMVNTQLSVEISGSSTPVAVAALAWGC
jgi:hypothetical protein